MNEIDIAPHQLVVPAQPLDAEGAKVDEELEVERPDIGAGIAVAGIVQHHQFDGAAKGGIGVFDQFDKGLPCQRRAQQRIADHGIAGRARDSQRRPGAVDQQLQQRLQHLLRVLQFRLAQVHGVAGDVGDEEIALLGGSHGLVSPGRNMSGDEGSICANAHQ